MSVALVHASIREVAYRHAALVVTRERLILDEISKDSPIDVEQDDMRE